MLLALPRRLLDALGRLRDLPVALQERFLDPPGPPDAPPKSDFGQLPLAFKITYPPSSLPSLVTNRCTLPTEHEASPVYRSYSWVGGMAEGLEDE